MPSCALILLNPGPLKHLKLWVLKITHEADRRGRQLRRRPCSGALGA